MHYENAISGYIRKTTDKKENVYTGWRASYINQSGLMLFFASDSKPGMHILYFFASPSSDCKYQSFNTTRGTIEREGNLVKMTTRNSIYYLELDENCLSAEDKKSLLSEVADFFGSRFVREKHLYSTLLKNKEASDEDVSETSKRIMEQNMEAYDGLAK